jgi:integrase/recombinase XerD
MSTQVTLKVEPYTYYKKKDGLFPVKLQLTFKRKTTYYPLKIDGKNVSVSLADWDAINTAQPRKNNKIIKEAIEDLKSRAREAIHIITFRNQPFSLERFERQFLPGITNKGFFDYFNSYLQDLANDNRGGSQSAYNCALQALKKFRNGRDLDPIDITTGFLKDFEKYLKSEKLEVTRTGKTIVRKASTTTVGIYMRTIRLVYNYIADTLPHLKEHYPFARASNERNKYQIQAGSGSKGDALTVDELKTFIAIETMPMSPEWRAQQLWLFSFYCNGMNFHDLAHLKFSNIKSDKIVYVRHKTSRTERNQELLEVPLTDDIIKIIESVGQAKKRPTSFVFDILSDDVASSEERRIINQKLKIVNKWLKILSELHGLPPITTYWARHSYASLLKESGQSVEMIREILGHSDIKTTEAYLKKFDFGRKREANQKIMSYLKK